MAQHGFDPAFGLEGTCASHISGFGGWPMAVFVGVDGRPTLVCSAPDQRPADQGVSPGGRFRGPPVTTIRIVSFPPSGRPVGSGADGIAVSVDPPADEPIYPERAIVRAGRIATGDTGQEFRGSWIVRLGADGRLDPAFGTNGLRSYPLRGPIELVRELADGTLHGYDESTGNLVPFRLGANGDPVPGFGTDGVKPITKPPITMPRDIEPDGEWFAPTWGQLSSTSMRWTVGLVRCGPDGVIDPNFGAGAAKPSADCFVDVASVHSTRPLLGPDWNGEGGPHQTLRLADSTLLTIWSLSWQVNLTVSQRSWRPWGMVLMAWTAGGLPRAVPAWGGKPAKAMPNPLSVPPLGSFSSAWLGWRNQCAVLQPDGSILVGLAGDDESETRATPLTPRALRQSAYFCRLLPPDFELDPGFGSGGILVQRLPDDGYRRVPDGDPRSAGNLVDSQLPGGLALLGPRVRRRGPVPVAAAIACRAVYQRYVSQGGLGDVTARSPDLPFDGSVGVARLI